QDHQNAWQLSKRRCCIEAALPSHQERRSALAPRHRVDNCYGPVCHPVRRAISGNGAMTMATGIMARPIVAWLASLASSPAPSARRYAALGLDRSLQPTKLADHAFDAPVRTHDDETVHPRSQKSLTQNLDNPDPDPSSGGDGAICWSFSSSMFKYLLV